MKILDEILRNNETYWNYFKKNYLDIKKLFYWISLFEQIFHFDT